MIFAKARGGKSFAIIERGEILSELLTLEKIFFFKFSCFIKPWCKVEVDQNKKYVD